jgi:hypothetical protein
MIEGGAFDTARVVHWVTRYFNLRVDFHRLQAEVERLTGEAACSDYKLRKAKWFVGAALESLETGDTTAATVILRSAFERWGEDPGPPAATVEIGSASPTDQHHSDADPPPGPARRQGPVTRRRRTATANPPAAA